MAVGLLGLRTLLRSARRARICAPTSAKPWPPSTSTSTTTSAEHDSTRSLKT